MPAEFIDHKGKRILFVDYKSCKNQQEAFDLLSQSAGIILDQPDKVLVLIDFTDQHGSREYMKKAKELNKTYGHKVEKRAVLGVTGIKKILLSGYNKFSKNMAQTVPFDTKEEALDYLIR